MAANGPEPLEDDDPVAVFAAWMRELHREAKKPSYTEIVRRSRTRYPAATVRQSTISDTFNAKRLPRWDSVEPIAWVLGGDPMVAECLERWKQADAARSAPPPPPLPLPATEEGAEREHPKSGPAPEAPEPGRRDEVRRRVPRRTSRWILATVTVALGALGYVADRHLTDDTASPGASPTPTTASASPSSTDKPHDRGLLPSPSVSQPVREQLTAHLSWTDEPRETAWTRDGEIGISVTEAGTSLGYFVITDTRSCTVTGAAIGESTVLTAPADTWIRLIVTDVGHFSPEQPLMPVTFQITRGHGKTPHGKRACA
ncbi:hypothetical protein [Streptomyces sp. NPDC054874]